MITLLTLAQLTEHENHLVSILLTVYILTLVQYIVVSQDTSFFVPSSCLLARANPDWNESKRPSIMKA